jgi:GTPase SAR1 family protein
MFSLLNGVYDSYLAPTALNILVVGPPNVGKTTLLERIKVTQMSKRPNQAETLPIPLTAALHEAFAKGGSEIQLEGTATAASQGRDSSATYTAPSPSPAPVVVQKRRFKLSICPAPSRYSKTAQDQEEDFIVDDEPATSQDTGKDDTSKSIEEEMLTLKNQVCPDAPRRFRCHSKEFNVENLDILDGDTGGERRLTSMESIPLDDAQELSSPQLSANKQECSSSLLQTSANNQECSSSLLQENFEEFHLKPKARMLPLSKIRPTSKDSKRMNDHDLLYCCSLVFVQSLSWIQLGKN